MVSGPGFRNQVDALVPFGKALILITKSLTYDLTPYVSRSLAYKQLISSQVTTYLF